MFCIFAPETSCGSPGEVLNGRYNLTQGLDFGARVTAECDTGSVVVSVSILISMSSTSCPSCVICLFLPSRYVMVGSDTRYCMEGGWTGRVPVCEGQWLGGHKCVKTQMNTCTLIKYQWSIDQLLCVCFLYFSDVIEVKCEPPPVIAHGGPFPPKESYSYREVVEYHCKKDLTLIGSRYLHCSSTGEFEPDPPRCRGMSQVNKDFSCMLSTNFSCHT